MPCSEATRQRAYQLHEEALSERASEPWPTAIGCSLTGSEPTLPPAQKQIAKPAAFNFAFACPFTV